MLLSALLWEKYLSDLLSPENLHRIPIIKRCAVTKRLTVSDFGDRLGSNFVPLNVHGCSIYIFTGHFRVVNVTKVSV